MTKIERILRGAATVALAVGITLTTFGAPVVSADHQGGDGEFAPPGCAFGNDQANEQTGEAPGCEIAEAARENAHGHEDQDQGQSAAQDDDDQDKDHGQPAVNRGNNGHGNGNGQAGAGGHGNSGRGRGGRGR